MKIVCFGDSLTRGVSYIKGRLRIMKNNYPSILQELFDGFSNDIDVINKGVFNDNSDLLLDRLDKDVLEEKPQYVIIGIGGNDCNFQWDEVSQHPDDEHQPIVPIDRYINNLKVIMSKIKMDGITPVLLTLPPLDPVRYYKNISDRFSSQISSWICKVGGIEHWHGMYNHYLNKVVSELDVIKIDVRTVLKQAGDLVDLVSDDGIHLTEKGYKVLGTEIFESMTTILEGNRNKMKFNLR